MRLRFNLVEIPKPPKKFERIVDSLIFLEKYSSKTHLDAVQERLYKKHEKRGKGLHCLLDTLSSY